MPIKYHSASTNKDLRNPPKVWRHTSPADQEEEQAQAEEQEQKASYSHNKPQPSHHPKRSKEEAENLENTPKKLQDLVTLVYALQVASFFIPFTGIAGVIINYSKKDDVKDTWLESHFQWQIRTFWISFIWSIIGFVLVVFIIGIFILLGVMIWYIIRIINGWTALSEGKPILEKK